MCLFGLCQRSLVSDLSSKPMALLDLSHFPSTSPVISSPPAHRIPTSLWRWLLAISSWAHLAGEASAQKMLECTMLAAPGLVKGETQKNTEKLLFSSLLLEKRMIFWLCHRVLFMASLANSIGYIYLFPFTEVGLYFFLSGFIFLSKLISDT